MKELTGRHVFGIMALGFGTIIAVNAALAINAVRTFPGLEVKNSYVASQGFDRSRIAQEALNWDVSATLDGSLLTLRIVDDGQPVRPEIETATFGRATSVAEDQTPDFAFNGEAFTARVAAEGGNWNLRLKALAPDGTLFQQRIIVEGAK